MVTAPIVFVAFLGGFIPALLWLVFWQLEDHCDPEPKKLLLLAFFVGLCTVPFAIVFEKGVQFFASGTLLLLLWAAIEELLKFAAAWLFVLRNRAVDEPIDTIIYMITVALGFAALENTLFLLKPILGGDVVGSVLAGDVRFIGATLLHSLASATIGVCMGFAFYRSKRAKQLYTIGGITLAVLLHTLFNFLILARSGNAGFSVFLMVWVGAVALLLFFERLKRPARDYC